MKKGMNPEAVRQMGTQIADSGEGVKSGYTTVQGRVNDFDWTGEDRDRYVSDFEGTIGGLVETIVQQLGEFGERASSNAEQQETASS